MQSKSTIKYSLQVCNSNIAREWHPTKNGSLTPSDVSVGSNRKVWWLCSKGHAWPATVSERNQGSGCPYCSDKKVKDENSLQTEIPTGATESLPAKNESLTPKNIAVNSDKKVKDENSLQTVNPTLAKQWHPYKEWKPDTERRNSKFSQSSMVAMFERSRMEGCYLKQK